MNLEFRPADRPIISTSLDLLEKAVEAAFKANIVIGVPTTAIESVGDQCMELRKANRGGEKPDDAFEIPGHLGASLRNGLTIYLNKLTKVSEDQLKLTVNPEDTQERINEVRRTFERASGQDTLLDIGRQFKKSVEEGMSEGTSMTMGAGGKEIVTIHGRKKAER